MFSVTILNTESGACGVYVHDSPDVAAGEYAFAASLCPAQPNRRVQLRHNGRVIHDTVERGGLVDLEV